MGRQRDERVQEIPRNPCNSRIRMFRSASVLRLSEPVAQSGGSLEFCHRLILQSVHARETPNRLLIQLHCFSGVLTALILLVQFHETGQERTAVLIKLCVGHFDF